MFVPRQFATRDDLDSLARKALGTRHALVGVDRLRGGSKKGVYRLHLGDDSTAIAYIWNDAENYWPGTQAGGDLADPFSPASGMALLEAATRRLDELGVRTPRILLADRSRRDYPADVAVVEDVPGPNLEDRFRTDPRGAEPVMTRLAAALDAMHGRAAPSFGKVAWIEAGGATAGTSCQQVVFDRARNDLAEAAARDTRIGGVRERLAAVLGELRAAVEPRTSYALVHGELGGDHVLVDGKGDPVLIDTEGLMYFDVEWEHVFLRIRFADHYRHLARGGLDQRRMKFYDLAMRLSLVAGPLRLLDGDFPHRDGMLRIVEHNLRRALTYV